MGGPSTQPTCATAPSGCSIVSNGAKAYDGSPGHPNVFQGVVSNNTLTFYGAPFSNPGEYGIGSNRTVRGYTSVQLKNPVMAMMVPTAPAAIPITGNMVLREMKYIELNTSAISSKPSPKS